MLLSVTAGATASCRCASPASSLSSPTRESYDLEYGTTSLELPADAIVPGQRVVVVDDVLATGGTAEAACTLVERAGGIVTGVSVVLEIAALGGRSRLAGREVSALLAV